MTNHNLIIIDQYGKALNSVDYNRYGLILSEFENGFESENHPIVAKLIAIQIREGKQEQRRTISVFYELEEATKAITCLISSIKNKEQLFDTREYNSNT